MVLVLAGRDDVAYFGLELGKLLQLRFLMAVGAAISRPEGLNLDGLGRRVQAERGGARGVEEAGFDEGRPPAVMPRRTG